MTWYRHMPTHVPSFSLSPCGCLTESPDKIIVVYGRVYPWSMCQNVRVDKNDKRSASKSRCSINDETSVKVQIVHRQTEKI